MDHIKRILKEFPFVVLDGGFATELEKTGYDLKDRLWSAKILSESPGAVRDVHLSYLYAGADCIITSSYQATIPGFIASGFTGNEAERLLRLSVKLAREAIDIYLDKNYDSARPLPFAAASAGCYGAYLANGSEYSGSYRLTTAEYRDFHRSRLDILVNAGADFIAFETFPNIDEASAVAELMHDYPDVHYWVVFTATDGRHITHGELFSSCAEELASEKNIAGIGINCSKPELISPLLKSLSPHIRVPAVVYPNSGEHFNIGCDCWSEEAGRADFGLLADEWYGSGARVIGGCCRTGPEDIKKISSFRRSLGKPLQA